MRKNYIRICKSIFLLLEITFFGYQPQANAQDVGSGYRLEYTMAYLRDTTEGVYRYEDTQLLVVGDQSLFQTVSHAVSDSIKYHELDPARRKMPTEHKYSILKDIGEGRVRHYEEFLHDHEVFYYDDELLTSNNWYLSTDTMTINGRLCQKAEVEFGNRHWTAWFDPSIGISDGPYKFGGLPGLIVRVSDVKSDGKESWIFELAKIEQISKLKIDLAYLHLANELESKLVFFKTKKETLDNAIQIRRASGGAQLRMKGDDNDAELSKIHNKHRMKDNNWIELYP